MIYHELYRTLCFAYKVVSIQYFMDEMQEYEVATVIDNIPYLDINEWEQTRQMIYVYAQSMSRKQLKPTDILSFKWDRDHKEHNTEISNSDIERLRSYAKKIEQQLQNE